MLASGLRMLLCGLLLFPGAVLAQGAGARQAGPGAISGTVVAEDGGAALGSATIAVRRMADSVVVGGRIADREGRFRVEGLPVGRYLVEIRAVGRAPRVERDVAVSAESPLRELGALRLAAAAVRVEGVTAQGQRSAVVAAPDRSIYSIRDMPLTQGAMATDALRTIPEVEIDFEDQIKARGGTPAIYLDGRAAPMQGETLTSFLRSLRADRIDRIEYIPNPSANFDSEGQSGIVNIVLRRDASLGLSGTFSGNAGTQGTQGTSLRVNYQEGRLTFFGGAAASLSDNTLRTFDLRENFGNDPVTFLEQSSLQGRDGRSGSVDGQLEWKVTPRSTTWASARANWGFADRTAVNGFARMDAGQVPTARWEQLLDGYNTNRSLAGSLGFRRVVQAQRDEFSAELRYNVNWTHSASDFDRFALAPHSSERLDLPAEVVDNDGYHDDDVLSFQTDLSRPLGEASKVDVGYRANLRDNQDEQRLFQDDAANGIVERSEHDLFRHLEDFHAGYVTLERRFGRVTAQAGLRGEIARTTVDIPTAGEQFDNDYRELYPSLNVAYDHGGGKQGRLSYSKRVQRPHSGVLNPINLSAGDPFNRNYGNPHLAPAFTHSVSLDGSWSGQLGTLRVSNFYFLLYDVWERTRTIDASGGSTLRVDNLGEIRYGGLNLNASLRQWGPLSGSTGFNLIKGRFDADARTTAQSFAGTFWSVNTNATVRLSPTLSVQGQGNYSPGEPLPQGRRLASFYSSVAIRKQLMENKVSVNLGILDPFDLYRYKFVTNDDAHVQRGSTNPSQRRATLTVSYNFGRPPQSARRTVDDPANQAPAPAGADIR